MMSFFVNVFLSKVTAVSVADAKLRLSDVDLSKTLYFFVS